MANDSNAQKTNTKEELKELKNIAAVTKAKKLKEKQIASFKSAPQVSILEKTSSGKKDPLTHEEWDKEAVNTKAKETIVESTSDALSSLRAKVGNVLGMTQEEVDQKSAEIVEYFSAPFIDRSKTTKTPEVEPYQSSYIEPDEASKKEAYQAAEADVEAKRQKESSFTFDNPMYEKKASPVLADETQFDIDKEKIALKTEMLESFYDPLSKLDKKGKEEYKKAYEGNKAVYEAAEAAVEAKRQKEEGFAFENPLFKKSTAVGRSSDDGRKKMDELQAKRMDTLEKDPEVRQLGKLFLNPNVKTSGTIRGNFKTRKVNSKGM